MTGPWTYELVLRGRASAQLLRPLLDDFTLDHTSPGITRLVGRVTDTCQLHGVLAHLTSVGVELISVAPAGTSAGPPVPPPAPHDPSPGDPT